MGSTLQEVGIEIGGMVIVVRTDSAEFAGLLANRYGRFVVGSPLSDEASVTPRPRVPNSGFPDSSFQLDIELLPPGAMSDAEEARVRLEGGRWVMERGDFRAECDPERHWGWVRQSANPYSIDAVLRMLHSLILARQGGFLLHAASAIRNGRAFLFAGVSGAGKTTISRLAPPDVAVLTDEISYVRKIRIQDSGFGIEGSEGRSHSQEAIPQSSIDNRPSYVAFGTPFAGELARIGQKLQAPVAALYLLSKGEENRIDAVSPADAARALLQNILFFADDQKLVRLVFESAYDFVSRVPAGRLVFARDPGVWELIK